MKKINKSFLKKFQTTVDNFDRCISLTGNIYGDRCEKSVFVSRFGLTLINKCFKLKIKGVIHYILFIGYDGTITSNKGKSAYKSGGVELYLGWSSIAQYEIKFINEKGAITKMILNYNDLLKLEYEEIQREEYYKIVRLFL